LIDQTWPFIPGDQGGFLCCLPSLPNEREANLAASFDPAGIKTLFFMEVKRSAQSVSQCLSDALLGKIYSIVLWSLDLDQFMMGPGSLIHYMVS